MRSYDRKSIPYPPKQRAELGTQKVLLLPQISVTCMSLFLFVFLFYYLSLFVIMTLKYVPLSLSLSLSLSSLFSSRFVKSQLWLLRNERAYYDRVVEKMKKAKLVKNRKRANFSVNYAFTV